MTEKNEIKNKKYEIAFVLKNDEAEPISRLLEKEGCLILEKNQLTKIRLAYPIKKENYGFFGYFYFEAKPEAINNFKKEVKLMPTVLRYLIITPPFMKKPIQKVFKTVKPAEEAAPPSLQPLTNEILEEKIKEIEMKI